MIQSSVINHQITKNGKVKKWLSLEKGPEAGEGGR